MLKDGVRDRLGFAFFVFAALIAGVFAWQNPSILAWLCAFHNLLLAWFFAQREPAKHYDRVGLWLGLIAALLPTTVHGSSSPWYLLIPGLAGYALILWSLIILGKKFGIAPADRGFTGRGPYHIVRHPMYLGELIFQATFIFSRNTSVNEILAFSILIGIQLWRIKREEALIAQYHCYSKLVRWRLMPRIW
jgi:protein-S-isoprenylcysteine O-methyltransferase Ste14